MSRSIAGRCFILALSALTLAGASQDQDRAATVPADAPAQLPSPAIMELRRHFNDESINALTFHSIKSIFETVPVDASGMPSQLASADAPFMFNYVHKGTTHPFDDIFERTYTNALIIVKKDKIVFERYRNYTGPATHFLSMSMAKSITSILIGAALADGKIKSVDDQIVDYVPELRGTAYDGVTIKDALLMKSGVEGQDNYQPDPQSAMAKLREEIQIRNQERVMKIAHLVKRAEKPGKTFRYLTLNTAVLGEVVARATGVPLQTFMSERLWKPLGAEAAGFWITDGPPGVGKATNGMGFNAVARDYARLGLMMLHEGKANGRQIIPAKWVKESTIPTGPEPAAPTEDYGYQYQWWTLANSNAYTAIGLQGQFIYVDPDTDTVVVKLSYIPLHKLQEVEPEIQSFLRAASQWPGH